MENEKDLFDATMETRMGKNQSFDSQLFQRRTLQCKHICVWYERWLNHVQETRGDVGAS